jgi:hypothetical protein
LVCFESGLPLVAIMDANIVVPPSDIKLHKECQLMTVHSREPIHEFVYEGEQGSISDGESVELLIVLDGLEIAILLLNKEERESVSGF